jgi:short-subunit dehydrogenase
MTWNDLHGAVTVITGATSGIGRATALAFADEHAQLVLVARDAEALAEVVRDCEQRGGRAIAVQADVTDAESMPAVAQAAMALGGRIDVWVNNAGTGAVGAFDETPMQAHEQVVQIDLLGYMRGAHAVLPYFKRQGKGVLVNLQSLGSWLPQPYAVAYSASKFGLRGFSEALRGELSRYPGIHVCDVFPSFVDTPGVSHGANYTGGRVRPAAPLLDPREVAAAVVSMARRPRNAVTLGVAAHVGRAAHAMLPGYGALTARVVEAAMRRATPVPRTDGALYQPPQGPRTIDGGWRRELAQGPGAAVGAVGVAVAVSVGVAALLMARPGRSRHHGPAWRR